MQKPVFNQRFSGSREPHITNICVDSLVSMDNNIISPVVADPNTTPYFMVKLILTHEGIVRIITDGESWDGLRFYDSQYVLNRPHYWLSASDLEIIIRSIINYSASL